MRGSVYLTMLFSVAFLGIALAAAGSLWATERQREKEVELLAIGEEFSEAIESYYLSSPGLVKTYPARLDDLLQDSRFLFVKRHLRQIYVDPMTGTREWHLVMSPVGGIQAVSSTSEKVPTKVENFGDRFGGLAGKRKYSDWVFGFVRQ
jgi:type II secretory pathway pseudopilin PulG